MNYKNKNNYKVISESDYKKLSYDMRLSYNPTSSVVSHGVDDDDILTSLSMMAIGSMLFDDSSSPSSDTSYAADSIEPATFDDFGGGDFGGGGAGGEW